MRRLDRTDSRSRTLIAVPAQGLGGFERRILSALAALERPTITAGDLVSTTGLSRQRANLALSRLSRKGWLRRLRRGVYKVVPLSAESGRAAIEDPLAVAMSLFAPCYISGWTAAEYWELTEQVSNSIMIRSAKPQRAAHQKLGGVNFIVRRVPESSIFGTTNVWSGTVAIVMATSHRTVIDLLDAPETGGGGRQALDIIRSYWQRPGNDPDLLLEIGDASGSWQRLQAPRVHHRTIRGAGKCMAGPVSKTALRRYRIA